MTTHKEQLDAVIDRLEQLIVLQSPGSQQLRRVVWIGKAEDVRDSPGGSKLGWKIEAGDQFDILAEASLDKDVWYQMGASEWVKAAKAITI